MDGFFYEEIKETIFSTNFGRGLFNNIKEEGMARDASFISTVRALLSERVGADETVTVSHWLGATGDMTSHELPTNVIASCILANGALACEPNHLYVVRLMSDKKSVENNVKFIFDHLEELFPGFHEVERVRVFYKNAFMVRCIINPETKTSTVIYDDMTPGMARFHAIQTGIKSYLPWFFEGDNGLTEEETQLLKAISSNGSEYKSAIDKIANRLDLRARQLKEELASFETANLQAEMRRVENDVANLGVRISDYIDSINECRAQITKKDVYIAGLRIAIAKAGDGSELAKCITTMSDVVVFEGVRNDRLVIGIRAPLDNWNDLEARASINNEDSYLYAPRAKRCDKIIPHDDMKRLMEAVFIERSIKLNACAKYAIAPGSGVYVERGSMFGIDYIGYTPNPHIDFHSCLGQYTRIFDKLIQRGDYIQIISQCIASCQSLNIMESATMQPFFSRLYGLGDETAPKCFEVEPGKILTMKEAAKWLKEKEEVQQ